MCEHKYIHSPEKRCQFSNILNEFIRNKKNVLIPTKYQNFKFDLPHDKDSICLFHSTDSRFKEDNKMIEQFKLLPSLLFFGQKNKIIDLELHDFEDFIFYGIELDLEGAEKQIIIDLTEIIYPEYTSFKNATFCDFVWFSYSSFKKAVIFEYAKFNNMMDFGNMSFDSRVHFNNAAFNGSSGFRESTFSSAAYFENCTFNSHFACYAISFLDYVTFSNSKFKTSTFIETNFSELSRKGITNFEKANFQDSLTFRDSNFNYQANFSNTKFKFAEFINTNFSSNQVTNFNNISVQDKLIFKSLDPQNKLFNHLINFDFNPNKIKGQIIFENANIYFINQYQKLISLAHPSIKKVIFGIGCDKYKLKKDFIVPLKEEYLSIIQEVANTFTVFFDWENQYTISLNVEFEYQKDFVTIRYFSDSDITQNQFEQKLSEVSPNFLEFISEPTLFLKNDLTTQQRKATIYDLDLYRKGNSLKTGLASRFIIDNQAWDTEKIIALLKTIANNPNANIAIEFHNKVINQVDLFSFNNKKYIAERDINQY